MSADRTGRWVGKSLRRVEDDRHLTGRARFVDDHHPGGLLHAALVRSPLAAADVKGIEVGRALAHPGVRRVFTAADLTGLESWVPLLNRPEFRPVELPILAADRVRHVGEPVAVVVADSPHAAEDGAEMVEVSYEERPAVGSIEAALAEAAPRVHDQFDQNVLLDVPFIDHPELDDAIEAADLVLEAEFRSSRLTAVPMEGRACLAEWPEPGRLVLLTSTQVPHLVRTILSKLLAMPEQSIRVIAPDVGGGFGQKCVVAREEVVLSVVSREVGRPVKWIEDREENLIAGFQGHEQRFRTRAGFDGAGRILALDVDILCDTGAYSTDPFTCGVEPLMAATEMPGPYMVERYRARTRAVATNKTPMAPYRGVSRPQMVLAMERLMQKAAIRLGIEVDEIRLRNLVPPEGFPHVSPTGLTLDEGSYHESVQLSAREIDLVGFRRRQREAREEGRLLGIGFCCFAERSGYGTEAFAQRRMAITPGYDTAVVRMDPSGAVSVAVGTSGHGQGHKTTLAQVAADELGIDPRRIIVQQGDTDLTPYGWGTFASRSMVIGGGATRRASTQLATSLRDLAAPLLDVDPDEVTLRDEEAVAGDGRSVAIADLARLSYLESHRLPDGKSPGLEFSATFDPPGTFSNACHAAIIEIDPQTAAISIERYLVVEDCGVMVNPAIVEGQVRGGVAQGLAAALYEELAYSEEGIPQSTSLMDYLVPTAAEIPRIEIYHLETPSKFSETGAKGMGEGGTMGAPACLLGAVNDALVGLEVEVDAIPIRPSELHAAIKNARRAERSIP